MTIDELRILRGLSMTKLCEAAGLSMGAVFKLTRPGAELERARLGTVMKLAAGLLMRLSFALQDYEEKQRKIHKAQRGTVKKPSTKRKAG